MEQKIEQMKDEELFQLLSLNKETAEKAFTELYLRYSPQVYAFCRRFLGNSDEAKDVYQDTFVKFHQSLDNNQNMANILGYLLRTARNLCINLRRNQKFTVTYEDYMTVTEDNRNENDELLNMIKTGIDLLPDEFKELFILREYDGLSYSEISDVTGLPLNTVKVKLFRAKKRLRKILEPYMENITNYE